MHKMKCIILCLPTTIQFNSVAQSCPALCNPMNRSTPGLPVHHQLPEFTQTHVHKVSDVIQPSHPLSSPSPPAPNPSQHQSLSAGSATSSVHAQSRHQCMLATGSVHAQSRDLDLISHVISACRVT